MNVRKYGPTLSSSHPLAKLSDKHTRCVAECPAHSQIYTTLGAVMQEGTGNWPAIMGQTCVSWSAMMYR